MQIAIFGAAGKVGRSVVNEALSRGHEVTAVVRNPAHFDDFPTGVTTRVGDALHVDEVAAISSGHDVVSITKSGLPPPIDNNKGGAE